MYDSLAMKMQDTRRDLYQDLGLEHGSQFFFLQETFQTAIRAEQRYETIWLFFTARSNKL